MLNVESCKRLISFTICAGLAALAGLAYPWVFSRMVHLPDIRAIFLLDPFSPEDTGEDMVRLQESDDFDRGRAVPNAIRAFLVDLGEVDMLQLLLRQPLHQFFRKGDFPRLLR